MRKATLCLLVKKENGSINEILLAMKKRSFGVGKWNGVGGKFDEGKGDKTILDAAIRETEEEIGVKAEDFKKVAMLRFKFPYKAEWDQDVHVFLAEKWIGEPKESEEMAPKWFKVSELPFDKMWDDDKYWLPEVLSGKKMEADFIFKKGEIISSHNIKLLDKEITLA